MTLSWAALGGLTAWAAHLALSYGVIALACGEERRLALDPTAVLVALSAVTLAAALHASGVAFAMWRSGRGPMRPLAFGGLLCDVIAAIAILAGGVVPAVVPPCS